MGTKAPSWFLPDGVDVWGTFAVALAEDRGEGRLQPGDQVGPFTLLRFIGAGGMGEVWAAVDARGANRALKILPPDKSSWSARSRFVVEGQAAARIDHPSVVRTYGAGEHGDIAWISQELVEGELTLRKHLNRLAWLGKDDDQRHLAWVTPASEGPEVQDVGPDGYFRWVADFVAKVADGVQAAHDMEVVHRDIKPRNLLIDANGEPKLADFGLAKVAGEESISRSGELIGSPRYMSPEQVTAKRVKVDHRTDVFSLGSVLFEMLTLRQAFDADLPSLANQILFEELRDPQELRAEVPEALAVVSMRCLEKFPSRRYQSMSEVAGELRQFLLGLPVRSRRPSSLWRGLMWIRRRPAVLFVTVALGLLFVSSVLAVLYLATRQDVWRLSAQAALNELMAEQADMWPAHPSMLSQYQDWLVEAEALIADLPLHEAKLSELRELAVRSEGGGWRFHDDADEWWASNLASLIGGLKVLRRDLLTEDAVTPEHGWSVRKRVAFARQLELGFEGGELGEAWERCLPAIREAYPHLELAPQMGLVPIGPDPKSGLWEFAHLASGVPAVRKEDGELLVGAEVGLVFVLIPAGTFWMGAQADDPSGRNYDPLALVNEGPVQRVALSAYFISKYEMTQGQWLRGVGENPSNYQPPSRWVSSLLHPVEQVSWVECRERLARLGLSLPSEAQWERGARGGTSSPWWTGEKRESLRGRVNLADQAAMLGGFSFPAIKEWPDLYDDGVVHMPVGFYPPNAFGLHEVAGNVFEWCLDGYARHPDRSSVDPATPWEGSATRVNRGGSFDWGARAARSTMRPDSVPDVRDIGLGVRPSRAITN